MIFSLSKTVNAVPVSYADGLLAFGCAPRLKVGKTARLKLLLDNGSPMGIPTTTVKIVDVEEAGQSAYMCKGFVQSQGKKLDALLVGLAEAGLTGACRRDSKRITAVLRIASQGLERFAAVTRDISLSGAQLICDGPVDPGAYLDLRFDLDGTGLSDVTMRAQCVRSLSNASGRYEVGVRFAEQQPLIQTAWNLFYQRTQSAESQAPGTKTDDTPTEAAARAYARARARMAAGDNSVVASAEIATTTIQEPPSAEPIDIEGRNLIFRVAHDATFTVSAMKRISLNVRCDEQVVTLPVIVALSRVEPDSEGLCACWSVILDEDEKVRALNAAIRS